ncbi:MAG: MBL fold metallo-hydrolase [Halobacteriota archaeon]|uniref:MBL fold metallo-hydrolase n=1 Tax=Natronomonas sp. TaxID=2184060 RepID=UPI003976FCEF
MDVFNVTADADVFTCNAYLVGGDRTVLVDAGAWNGVIDAVEAHTETLDAIMLTHQHSDHIAQLDAVLDAFDAPLYAYADHPQRAGELDEGDQVFIGDEAFDVVYTPGHADDHVSFVSETTLFSGDVVVHNDGAFDYGSFGRTDMAGQSRERLIGSIETLLDAIGDDVEHMYAGHGDEFHGDVRDVVETALGRAEKRQPKYPN